MQTTCVPLQVLMAFFVFLFFLPACGCVKLEHLLATVEKRLWFNYKDSVLWWFSSVRMNQTVSRIVGTLDQEEAVS